MGGGVHFGPALRGIYFCPTLRGIYFALLDEQGIPKAVTGTAAGAASVIGSFMMGLTLGDRFVQIKNQSSDAGPSCLLG